MAENQVLVQSLELLFNHVCAEVYSVTDLSDIHSYHLIFLLKTKHTTGHDLS